MAFLALWLGLFPLPAPAAAPKGFVHASGTEIVDGAGNVLRLRGVNLGGWLLWESYIIKFPGKDLTESRMKRALVAAHGQDAAFAFFRAHRENWIAAADIRRVRALGWNVVRIPFNARIFSPDGHFDMAPGEGWKVLDRALDWCEAAGVYAVLDMHSAPGGQNPGGISDNELQAGLWTGGSTTRYRDETAALWGEIARRYRKRTIVAAYDVINEPVVPNEVGGAVLVPFYRLVAAAIRAADPDHMLMVEGNWYATDFGMFNPPSVDANACYQFHKYWDDPAPGSITKYLDLRERLRAPVWLGETGENSPEWYGKCLATAEQAGIGWCFWPWKRAGGGCVEGVDVPPDWTTTPAGLAALAAAARLDRCREDQAVVLALAGAVTAPIVPAAPVRHDGNP